MAPTGWSLKTHRNLLTSGGCPGLLAYLSVMLIGLTGGIACGKQPVADAVATGALVDADQVARDVVAPGSEGLDALSQAFGPDVLDPSGHLDREALGRRG